MRIVIAPDKFKGCLSASAVAAAMAAGVRAVQPDVSIDICPMADGGEGTVAAMVAATGGRLITRRVTGPTPDMKVDATFGFLGDGVTAVVEMAAASGLALLPPDLHDPMTTTTFGTGELLAAAVELGATRILLGIGGSATIDAGIGCAQACGLPVLLQGGEPVADTEPLTGADLEKVLMVKHGRGGKVDRARIEVACDVTNPLYGPTGAAAVFGPQKGATPEQVEWFDRMLRQLARRTGNDALAHMPGAGAAGGLGFGMMAFFGASLKPGVDIVIEATRLAQRLKGADLCITGEGRLDEQSAAGKTAVGVARACKMLGVPCIAIAGSLGSGAEATLAEGITAYFSICDGPMTLDDAMNRAEELIARATSNVMRLFER